MTFYQDPAEKDVNIYVREPDRDSKTFEQEPLTVIDHIDPDKHWIGESLPAPSRSDVPFSGVNYSEGVLPFPARVDHTHDTNTYWGMYTQFATQQVAPGQTFLNPFIPSLGRDMRAPASSQVFVFPFAGIWAVELLINFIRVGGGIFTGELNIVIFFNNGATALTLWRDSMANIPGSRSVMVNLHSMYVPVPGAGVNFQWAIQHNDVVNIACQIDGMILWREFNDTTL